MTVTTTNLLAGAGELYTADFGATEPLDTAVASAPGAAFTNVGGTDGGVNLVVAQEFLRLRADQIHMSPASKRTSMDATLATALAEVTLANLARVLNVDPEDITAGTGYQALDIGGQTSDEDELYTALLFDGKAPAGKRRRIIARKVLSVENVGQSYRKDEQTFFPVTFRLHYVSASITPIHVVESV